MISILTVLRSELFNGIRSRATPGVAILPALVAMLEISLAKLFDNSNDSQGSLLGSSSFTDAIAENAYGPFVDGMLTGLMILGLMLVSYSAYNLSNDRDNGSLKHIIIRCASRRSVLIGKLIYLHGVALLSVLLLLLGSYLLSGSLWEYSAVIEDGFELISEQEIKEEVSLGLRLALLPLPASIAFGLFIATVSQTPTQAIVSALGFYLAVDIFKATLGENANYIFATFQPSLIDQSYLQDVSRLVRGYSDVLVNEQFLDFNTWVPFPSFLVLIILSLVVIQRVRL